MIVQNFLPKAGHGHARARSPCPAEEHLWSIAAARLVLPPEIHLQAPPNLTEDFSSLLERGHRRLGRRVAGDRRPRQPRAGLAGSRASCAR